MKPNHETIYLVPTDYDGGQLTYSWCDCPAPGEGMDPEDAIKYVRADLVPASNELLARRIVELTETVTALRNQLAAKPSDSGYAKLQKQVSEQSKVIEHVAAAVGCEDDPMSCWESVEALKAQVEQLQQDLSAEQEMVSNYHDTNSALAAQVEQLREDSLVAFGDGFYDGYLHYAKLCGDPEFTDDVMRQSELAEADSIYGKRVGSSVRVAEIKAQAVENLEEPLLASGKADADIGEWLKEQAKLIRQHAKAGAA